MKNYLFSHGHFCSAPCSVCVFHRHLMNLPSQRCLKSDGAPVFGCGIYRCTAALYSWRPSLVPGSAVHASEEGLLCWEGFTGLIWLYRFSFHPQDLRNILYFLFPLPSAVVLIHHTFLRFSLCPYHLLLKILVSCIFRVSRPHHILPRVVAALKVPQRAGRALSVCWLTL